MRSRSDVPTRAPMPAVTRTICIVFIFLLSGATANPTSPIRSATPIQAGSGAASHLRGHIGEASSPEDRFVFTTPGGVGPSPLQLHGSISDESENGSHSPSRMLGARQAAHDYVQTFKELTGTMHHKMTGFIMAASSLACMMAVGGGGQSAYPERYWKLIPNSFVLEP